MVYGQEGYIQVVICAALGVTKVLLMCETLHANSGQTVVVFSHANHLTPNANPVPGL